MHLHFAVAIDKRKVMNYIISDKITFSFECIQGITMSENNNKMITIADVAKFAGVSTATAGRVLGNYGNVKEKNKARVLEAAQQLGYSPNELARGLRSHKSNFIAVIVGSISNNFFSNTISAIEKEARKLGYSVIICNSHESVEEELKQLQSLKEHMVEGAIISSAYTLDRVELEKDWTTYEKGLPVVLMDRRIGKVGCHIVESDNYNGSYKAIQYLINLGHEHIGVIGSGNYSTIADRIKGYKDALAANGIECNENYITYVPMINEDTIHDALLGFLKKNCELTACMVLNNSLCTPFLICIDEIGKKMPNDMSIISWDDSNLNVFLGITTVTQDPIRIGTIAVNRLKELINKENTEIKKDIFIETVNVELIIRNSCKAIK